MCKGQGSTVFYIGRAIEASKKASGFCLSSPDVSQSLYFRVPQIHCLMIINCDTIYLA